MNNNILKTMCTVFVFAFTITNVCAQKIQRNITLNESHEGVPIVKPWRTIVQQKPYNGMWTVAGDLTGDGRPELLCAKAFSMKGENFVGSIIIYDLDNKVLWTWGNPGKCRETVGSDLACQVYDWDNDGKNDVIISTYENDKTWIVQFDGATGKEKHRFEIPEGASDCFTFCNISGEPFAYPQDVIVKTRYSQLWAYDYKGNQLWTIYRPGKHSTAHQAVPFDLDKNGIDEIMTGYVMVDHEGNPMWIVDMSGTSGAGHLDAVRLYKQGSAYVVLPVLHPSSSLSRLIVTYCNGRKIAMIDGVGREIWKIPYRHFQSVDIGKVRNDVFGNQIIVDAASDYPDENGIWIIDGEGNPLTIIASTTARIHRLIDWFGNGFQSIFIAGTDNALYDGYGDKQLIFDTPEVKGAPYTNKEIGGFTAFVGDMTGDSIPDVVLYSHSTIHIYKNEKGMNPEGKNPMGTGPNYTLY